MLRKSLISLTFAVWLLAPAPATAQSEVMPRTDYKEVGVQGEQIEAEGDWIPSTEVNTVQESKSAREAIRAEKARNAAENDRFGGAITLIAMGVVISALVILSVLFLLFGYVSSSIQKSKKRKAHGVTTEDAEDHHEELDSGEVIAAIGLALAEHSGQGHDIEDTILTIRRMRKAYSPWNSKIYNLRPLPAVAKAKPVH